MKNLQFKKLFAMLLVIAVISVAITGCKGSKIANSSAQTGQNTAKVINVGDQAQFFLFKVAKEKGYFKKEFGSGIKVNVISYVKQGPAVVESMASKNIDLAMLGTLPIVTADANGNKIVALASGNYSKAGFALYAAPGSGIKKVEELKGKSIGVTFGTNDHEAAIELLEKHHLKTTDVKLVNMQSADVLIALKKKELSCALLKANYFYSADKAHAVKLADNSEIGPVANMIVGRKDFIENNPKLTERFLKVCSEAAKYVESHENEAVQIAAKSTGSSTNDVKVNYSSRTRLVSIDSKYFLTPLQKSITFAKAQSLITKNIAVKDIQDTSYFKKSGIK